MFIFNLSGILAFHGSILSYADSCIKVFSEPGARYTALAVGGPYRHFHGPAHFVIME